MNERAKGYYLDILEMNEMILYGNCILLIVCQLESAKTQDQAHNKILLNIVASLWKSMPLYCICVMYDS